MTPVDAASRPLVLPDRRAARSSGVGGTPLRIGEKLSITGEIAGEGDLELAGRFEGRIRVQGTVVVTEHAEVDADITASRISVAGRVGGNLDAAGHVDIAPRGRVAGNVSARSMTVAEGARLKGQIMLGPAARQTEAEGTGVQPETRLQSPTSIGLSRRSSGRIG